MSIRIGLGPSGFPFQAAADFWRWVQLCEESDVDSLWFTDRLSSPASSLEPITTLAALAGATRRLKFGMSAIVLPFRDPLVLARECATIDYLSDGRLLTVFGVGGEDAPEWQATGRSPGGRGRLSDEMIELLTRLWSEESVTFEGEHFRYRDAAIAPRPVQRPLPLWIGGSSPAAVRRTARYGTGWLAGLSTPAQVAPVVAAVRRAVRESGRTIDQDHYGAGFLYRFGDPDEAVVQRTGRAIQSRAAASFRFAEYAAVGDADAIVGRVREYVAAGVSKFVLRPMADGPADLLLQTRRLIGEVLPVVHAPGFAAD